MRAGGGDGDGDGAGASAAHSDDPKQPELHIDQPPQRLVDEHTQPVLQLSHQFERAAHAQVSARACSLLVRVAGCSAVP